MQQITSRSNERIKAVVRLQDKKERIRTGLFFTEGIHLAEEYVRLAGIPKEVYFTEKAYNTYKSFISALPENILFSVTDSVFEKISTESAPQGIICVCEVPKTKNDEINCGGVLFLESVRDAGNLGTVIRTAFALGVKRVVLSSDCADIYNPKTLRASMGTVFGGNIHVASDFNAALLKAKEYGKVYATALHENSLVLGAFKLSESDSFVIGNEGQGISEQTKSVSDATVIIPMTESAESLNASAAAAIIIWEMTRIK